MARISTVPSSPVEEAVGPGAVREYYYYAHDPKLARAMAAFGGSIMVEDAPVPPRLLELIRIRIAFHNQCRRCMALRYESGIEAGVDEDLVCSLEKPQEADDLTAAERSALGFADLFATDHLAIDDATYAGLREHFSEKEIVGLGMLCAFLVGFGRLAATIDMVEELPDRFVERDVTITPWGGDEVVPMGFSTIA